MFERIMVPLDGSKFAEQALPYAKDIAEAFKSVVYLATVVGLQAGTESAAIVEGIDQSRIEDTLHGNIDLARDYLESVGHDLNAVGITVQRQIYEDSSTEDALLAGAREHNVDLVVIATHGRSGIKRSLMGSVADQLMRDPTFPVLAVRPIIEDEGG